MWEGMGVLGVALHRETKKKERHEDNAARGGTKKTDFVLDRTRTLPHAW